MPHLVNSLTTCAEKLSYQELETLTQKVAEQLPEPAKIVSMKYTKMYLNDTVTYRHYLHTEYKL